MKPPKYLIAAITLHALLAFTISTVGAASGGKNDANQRGGKGAEHRSSKGSFNTNSQWSADPDKGWVRADERHKQHDKDHPRDDVRPKNGKPKGKTNKS
jgi:hypothetical protein